MVFSLVRRPDGSIDPLCLDRSLFKHLAKMFCKFHRELYHPKIEKAIRQVREEYGMAMLDEYTAKFSGLLTDKDPAPHKPFVLLSVMDLMKERVFRFFTYPTDQLLGNLSESKHDIFSVSTRL